MGSVLLPPSPADPVSFPVVVHWGGCWAEMVPALAQGGWLRAGSGFHPRTGLRNLSGQPVPVLDHKSWVFLVFKWNLRCFNTFASCPGAELGAGCRRRWCGINSAGRPARTPAESFSSHTGSFSFGATLRFGVSRSAGEPNYHPRAGQRPAWEAEESRSLI